MDFALELNLDSTAGLAGLAEGDVATSPSIKFPVVK